MVIIGVAIGVSLAILATIGLVAMAMFVSATEDGRYCDGECIEEGP